jgi:regulator of sigma D
MTKADSRARTSKAAGGQERRTGTRTTIDHLVAERTEMLTLYCRVAGLEPFEHNRGKNPGRELLREFCQVLVDYLAAAHFSLYDRIASGNERRRKVADLAAQLYPRIAESTQVALDFNDKYDSHDFEANGGLHDDLSRLGELLAARIEVEDQLIAEMLA